MVILAETPCEAWIKRLPKRKKERGETIPKKKRNRLKTDLLLFDFECRQENGTHEPNLCIVHNEAGNEWIFEWLFTDETYWLHRDGSQFPRL